MSENTTEVLTGAGVLALAIGFLIYIAQVGGVGIAPSGTSTYSASFRSAPIEKLSARPVSTIAETSGSSSNDRAAEVSSRIAA